MFDRVLSRSLFTTVLLYLGTGEVKITLLYDRNIVIYENILEINKPTLEIAREGSGEPWSFTLSADVTVGRKIATQDWFVE